MGEAPASLRKQLLDNYRKPKEKSEPTSLKALKLLKGVCHITLSGKIIVPAIGDCAEDNSAISRNMQEKVRNVGETIEETKFCQHLEL